MLPPTLGGNTEKGTKGERKNTYHSESSVSFRYVYVNQNLIHVPESIVSCMCHDVTQIYVSKTIVSPSVCSHSCTYVCLISIKCVCVSTVLLCLPPHIFQQHIVQDSGWTNQGHTTIRQCHKQKKNRTFIQRADR